MKSPIAPSSIEMVGGLVCRCTGVEGALGVGATGWLRPRAGPAGTAQWSRRPVETAKTLDSFQPSELSGMERFAPPIDRFLVKECIGEVIHSIRALFNYSGDQNMPRVLAANNGLLAHCGAVQTATLRRSPRPRCVSARRRGTGGEGGNRGAWSVKLTKIWRIF